jgi:Transposase domain (DUF772)
VGAPAKPFRMALGALIIKERLGTSDEETVEQIRENPYLQYFLGLSAYSEQAPFESSMMVHFRKRLLSKHLYRQLLIISELFRQQQWMYQQRQHRVDDRIVSLSQPQVQPIVRGKAGTSVESGAKFSASCVNRQVLIDHLDWNNFNASGDLPQQIEQY